MFRMPAPTFRAFRTQFPVITVILGINVILFLAMTFSGGSTETEVLTRFGAKVGFLIDDGQWWRLITPIFLHIGVEHLFFNGFALYVFGPTVEWLLGHTRFALFYVVAGIGGNVASYLFNWYSTSAGASGAIYGLFGFYMYLYLRVRRYVDGDSGKGILVLVGINLLMSLSSGIDLAAHVGGLVTGFILTPLLLPRHR